MVILSTDSGTQSIGAVNPSRQTDARAIVSQAWYPTPHDCGCHHETLSHPIRPLLHSGMLSFCLLQLSSITTGFRAVWRTSVSWSTWKRNSIPPCEWSGRCQSWGALVTVRVKCRGREDHWTLISHVKQVCSAVSVRSSARVILTEYWAHTFRLLTYA